MTITEIKEKIKQIQEWNPGAMPEVTKAPWEMNRELVLAQLEVALQIAVATVIKEGGKVQHTQIAG